MDWQNIENCELEKKFLDLCLEKCSNCKSLLYLKGKNQVCPKCRHDKKLKRHDFYDIQSRILDIINEAISSIFSGNDIEKIATAIFLEQLKTVNQFIPFSVSSPANKGLPTNDWEAILYIFSIIKSFKPNLALLSSNPPDSLLKRLIDYGNYVIQIIQEANYFDNSMTEILMTDEPNISFKLLISSPDLDHIKGYQVFDRPIKLRLFKILEFFGLYRKGTDPKDIKDLLSLTKRLNIELFDYDIDDGIILHVSKVISAILSNTSRRDFFGLKILSNNGITGDMLINLYLNLKQFVASKHADASGIILTLEQTFDYLRQSNIPSDCYSALITFAPVGNMNSRQHKESILSRFGLKILDEDIPVFIYFKEIIMSDHTRYDGVFIDPSLLYILGILLSRFKNNWQTKQDFEGPLMEKKIIKKTFEAENYKFFTSLDIETYSKQNKLMTMKARGEFDGIAINEEKGLVYIIESKSLMFPATNWMNKANLGFIAMQIEGIIKGYKTRHKIENGKTIYQKKVNRFNLITKKDWISDNWAKIKFSSLTKDKFKFVPIIITNIPSPLIPKVFLEVEIKTVLDLTDYLKNI